MSTTTLSSGSPAPVQHRPGTLGVAHTVTFGRLVRAEWIKVRALRSTYWTLGAAAFLHGLIPTLLGLAVQLTNEEGSATTPADSFALLGFGTSLSVFLVIVFAVLQITGEYRTGLIRSSFAADPRRLPTLGAKAVVVTGAAVIVGVVGTLLAVLGTLPFSGALDLDLRLVDAETWRLLFGPTLYIAGWALFSLGIGAMLRSTAATLSIVIVYLMILDGILMILPLDVIRTIYPYMPAPASAGVTQGGTMGDLSAMIVDGTLSAWQGFGVFGIWVAVVFVGAALLVRRRDA